MRISALLPYKPGNGERDEIFKFVKKRYEELMPNIELCIGIDNSEYFNKSRAVNKAARQATGEVFIIVDTDVIFNINLIDIIISNIDNFPWIIPFSNGYRLNAQATQRILKEAVTSNISISLSEVEDNCVIKGALMNVMKRECFEKIGGMDERFEGWGGEDEALAYTLETICGTHGRLNEDIYHLRHPCANVNNNYYLRNFALYARYANAMSDINKMMEIINEKSLLL